ncbi:MAG TPA: 3-methyl-2-oxobutanoate hydroxymethyltransferase [Bryobacteraceae bacterium]|nr:3-methyl-2-oxobutanoate hydroxymethyltransferase [Bryobacteraceae bacterium]
MTGIAKKVRVPELARMKERREPIVMLTAYDATMARLFDRAGIDMLLVGDSLGKVILGLDTTVPVSLEAIIHHTRAVTRGASRALVVSDMPFLTYQVTTEQAMRNAARIFQEGGAAAVKLEGGRAIASTVRQLTSAGLPVMGHLGLTPQHVHRLGGMRQQARDEKAAQDLLSDALALEESGAFALVLEAIPDAVAAALTSRLQIPTIGIGAGPYCDGQVLVSYDALGLFDTFVPPFVKQYAQLGEAIVNAAKSYADDVRHGTYRQAPLPVRMYFRAFCKRTSRREASLLCAISKTAQAAGRRVYATADVCSGAICVASACSIFDSCATSRVTIAKRKPADRLHISTPVIASMGPSSRHALGSTRSP